MDASQQNPLKQLFTAQQKEFAHEYAPTFVSEQIAAMLSTTPSDEEEVKRLLGTIYGNAELASPTIRWFDSPVSFVRECLRVPFNKHGAFISLPIYQLSLWLLDESWQYPPSGDQHFLCNTIMISIFSALRHIDDIRSHVQKTVKDRSWAHMREYMIRRYEKDTTWGSSWWMILVGYYIYMSIVAYQEASTLACIRFLYEVLERIPDPHLLDVLARIDQTMGSNCLNVARFNELVSGYRLGHKEAWLVRKPVLLERDEQGRWHHTSGPCVRYRDGWGWYAWHGVTVPEQIILHPERLTKWDWIRQRNVEVRRAIQERLGNERFMA